MADEALEVICRGLREQRQAVTKASRIGVGRWETSLRLGGAGTEQSRTGGMEKCNQK